MTRESPKITMRKKALKGSQPRTSTSPGMGEPKSRSHASPRERASTAGINPARAPAKTPPHPKIFLSFGSLQRAEKPEETKRMPKEANKKFIRRTGLNH